MQSLGSSRKRKGGVLSGLRGAGSKPGQTGLPRLPEEEETLDATFANRGVWLLKVPRVVADRWAERGASGEAAELARLRVGADGGVRLSLVASENEAMGPREYILEAPLSTAGGSAPSFVMLSTSGEKREEFVGAGAKGSAGDRAKETTEKEGTSEARSVHVEGKVVYRLDARPVVSGESESQYLNFARQRTAAASSAGKSGGTRLIDHRERAAASALLPVPTARPDLLAKEEKEFRKRTLGAGAELAQKRDDLYDTIFKCFEERERWALKDIYTKTKVPIDKLREVLLEVALKNTRGPYIHLYQLKPEYRKRKMLED